MSERMITLNQKYLFCLSEQYTLESVYLFEADLFVYRVKPKRKTFVHFILIDRQTNSLLFDRDYYYSGMKQMMNIYQECFAHVMQDAK